MGQQIEHGFLNVRFLVEAGDDQRNLWETVELVRHRGIGVQPFIADPVVDAAGDPDPRHEKRIEEAEVEESSRQFCSQYLH